MRNGLHEGAGASVCPGRGAVPAAGRPRRSTVGAGRSRTDEPSDGGGASPALAGAISWLGFRLPPAAYRRAQRPGAPVPTRVLVALALVLGAFGTLFGSHGSAHAQTATVSVADAEGNENTGVVFTITLHASATTTPTVTVRYRTSNFVGATAVQAPIHSSEPGGHCSTRSDGMQVQDGASVADYEYTTGTVVFEEGSPDGATETVRVPVCPGRPFPEEGRSFGFEFLEVTGASCETSASCTEVGDKAIGTIRSVPVPASTAIELMLNPTSVGEGDRETTVTVTASLDMGARTEATEVTVSVTGNTAIAGTDFTAVEPRTVTILAGQTSTSTTFTFTPIQDETAEDDETLTVSGSATGLMAGTATLTLTDDDMASTAIVLALDRVSVGEGDGETTVTVTASLDMGARTAATEVMVSVAGNTAIAGTDFTAVEPRTVTILAGQTSTSTTFTFTPIQDETAEGEETLTVSGSATGLTDGTATLTLTDDDMASTAIVLALAPASVGEGDGATEVTVTASLNMGARTEATEVTVSVAGTTAIAGTDFTAVDDFTVTILAGQTSTSTTFMFTPIPDETAEGEETLTVSGSATGLTDGTATLTLTDDDMASTAIVLALDTVSVGEGDGATEVTVTASLDMGARTEATEVTVSVAGTTAIAGTDFTAVDDFTVTILAGQTSTSTTFMFTPIPDEVDELDETVTVSGTATSGPPVTSAELTLTDDDAAPEITIAAVLPSVTEANDATADFVVRLSAPSEKAVNVTYSTREGTAKALYDFIGQADVLLTIDPGDVEMTIQIALVNDELYEVLPEQFAVQLFLPRNATLVEGNTFAIGTIADDDPEPTLSIAAAEVRENEGTITFAVTLSPASGGLVLVDYATEDVTAIGGAESEGADYASVPRGRLVFRPGVTQQTLTVDVFDDELADGTETFTIRLSMAVGAALDVDSAVGTITDDDTASTAIALRLDPVSVAEGATSTVTVTAMLDAGAHTDDTPVTVSVGDGGDSATSGTDYDAVNDFTVTISSGQTSGTGTFTLTPVDDNVAEDNETLTVSGSATGLTDGTATLTLTDDDMASTAIVLALDTVSVGEGDGATEVTVTASLDMGARTEATEVTVSVAGNTAIAGTDFTVVEPRTVTILAGQTSTSTTFAFNPTQDETAEGEETLTVSGSATGLTDGTATLTLTDDDMASTAIVLALAPASVGEGDGATR